MDHELHVEAEAGAAAAAAADAIAEVLRAAERKRGTATMAVSGGNTPGPMFSRLAALGLPWQRIVVYQVDERIAPEGDPVRNLTDLRERLGVVDAPIRPMPVDDDDLDAAASRYGASLPERFDVIHLGMGPDGHTASLVPGDPVLEITDQPVAMTGPYQERRRMTLTFPALARTSLLVWLVAGDDKVGAMTKLLAGDRSVPAGRVVAPRSEIFTEPSAVPRGR
jgi:6-phosphogluconolactonase